MIKNLIIVAIRNFRKDKGYSLLNVLGLTIGMTFSLLLVLYVLDELSFDKYHEKAERIFRINSYAQEADKDMNWAVTQFPLGPTLKKDYPEVEHASRFVSVGRNMYGNADRKFYEEKIFYADSNVFEIFSHRFLEGHPGTALVAPNSIVLTQALAEKYFGRNKSALGKSLQTSGGEPLNVTGVIENVPKNSHLIFNALLSMKTLSADFRQGSGWGNFGLYTYVLLKPEVNSRAFEKKLGPMYDKYMASIFAQYHIKIRYGVQNITTIHLHSEMTDEPEELGSMSYIYIFSSVALFMLLIACINYMNLTTARSARRAKEIGIRKVAGSSRMQLMAQFLTESVVITLLSLIVSLVLLHFFLGPFNSLAGKTLEFSNVLKPQSLFVLLAMFVAVGLLGGSYPAIYLSGFNPIAVLKGNLSKASANVTLRRVLVTFQFSISMVMIICTWVVYSQLRYMREKELGFDRERMVLLAVNEKGDVRKKVTAFKNELRKNAHVLSVSSANAIPGGDGINFLLFSMETKKGYQDKGVNCYNIDEHYLDNLKIKLLKGRNFNKPSDTAFVIVNENMVKTFGWNDPLGKKIKFPGDTTNSFVEVVGVVKDFHQKSLYDPIAPLILFYSPTNRSVQVKIAPGDPSLTLASLETSWKHFFPSLPFAYTFLDEDFDSQYAADKKRGKIFTSFSILTILITCLGLIGLIAFTTEQRQKEISIRKVMGAGILQIVSLVGKSFLVLVVCSCLIAFPIAWYFMQKWLEAFPYKAGLQLSTFLLSALMVILITALTIGFHTLKVAMANPVKSLKTE